MVRQLIMVRTKDRVKMFTFWLGMKRSGKKRRDQGLTVSFEEIPQCSQISQ
jgi:hypothetical protein